MSFVIIIELIFH